MSNSVSVNARYYQKNKERFADHRKANRSRARQFILDYKKDNACVDCGECYPHYVMDFDHITDDKDRNISRLINAQASNARLLIEIAKCELVCSNCHRERTWKRNMPD